MNEKLNESAAETARETDGMPPTISTPEQDAEAVRKAWLKERETGIGASDAAAALGVSPWKSRFQLWAEKTGIAEPPNLDEIEAVQWGNLLESVILETFARRTGREVTPNQDHEIVRHSEHLWLIATPDAWQNTARGRGVLEVKTAGYWAGQKWEDEPPLHYQIQLQHQLAGIDNDWGTLACLIGGQKLVWFDMERNDKFIASMIEKEAEFWAQVITKTPPEPDGSIQTAETLKRLYPKDDGEIISLPPEAGVWDDRLVQAKAAIKKYEDEKRDAENRLKAALGSATAGVLPSGDMYTFKQQISQHKAKEAYTSRFRVLRRKATK